MTPDAMTTEAVRGLVEAATPGPWKVCETSIGGKKYGGCWVEGPDEPDDEGRLHGTLIPMSGSHGSKSYTTRLVDRQDHDHNDANARLIALAPTLAAEVIALRERVAELEGAGWQPIETAPRDGTKIDLWGINHLHYAKKCERLVNTSWGPVTDWIGGERLDWKHGRGEGFEPTHWMALPAPPSAALNPTEGVE